MIKYLPHTNGSIIFKCNNSSEITSNKLRNLIYELAEKMYLNSIFKDDGIIILNNKIKIDNTNRSSESYKVEATNDNILTTLKNIRKIIMEFFMMEEKINIDVGKEAIPIVGTIIYYSNIRNNELYKKYNIKVGSEEWLETWFNDVRMNTLQFDERYSAYSYKEFSELKIAIKNALLRYVDSNIYYDKNIKKDLSEIIIKAIE